MSKHILIVEETVELREVMKMMFERHGYTVQAVGDGYSALALLLSQQPSAIIIGDLSPRPATSRELVNDIQMDFTRHRVPVVMLSTQTQPEDVRLGLAFGADLYLTKPFSMHDLVAKVTELVSRAAA